jgi:hypothetical protein
MIATAQANAMKLEELKKAATAKPKAETEKETKAKEGED